MAALYDTLIMFVLRVFGPLYVVAAIGLLLTLCLCCYASFQVLTCRRARRAESKLDACECDESEGEL